MAKLNIFTDTHLGVSRKANTTASSSQRLNDALYAQALACCDVDGDIFHAGDLFDKSFNPERVIAQGIEIASRATVLSGNHDETNSEGSVTSLQLVAQAWPGQVIRAPKISEPYFAQPYPGVFCVPHHASQEIFMQALQQASEAAAQLVSKAYLFIHCNRGQVIGDTPDSTLVITDEDEDVLLGTFQAILYGHEHRPAAYKGDRVIVLGNTHPTGFGDVSNKYRYVLDTETGHVTSHLIWSESEHFARIKLGDPLTPNEPLQFIEVRGAGTRQDVARYVQEVWDTFPQSFAVRSVCEYTDGVRVEDAHADFHDIPTMIARDLEGTGMLALMQEIREGLA